MENEINSSNNELLSLCFRYVDSNKELTKSFLEHAKLECKTGSHYPKDIESHVRECKGQCYDRAPNIQLEKSGTASF